MRDGGNVAYGSDLKTCGLQGSDSSLASGPRPFDPNLDPFQALFNCFASRRLGRHLRGKGGRLLGAFETGFARCRPRDDVSPGVTNRDNRIVKGRFDMGNAYRFDLLPFLLPFFLLYYLLLLFCQLLHPYIIKLIILLL
jgi:hypothetical protein